MYHVRFYVTDRGRNPVWEFIQSLDNSTKRKIKQLINLLEEIGPQLKRPYADKVDGKIYELRSKQSRVLYFFAIDKEIIFVHGFLKKRNAIPSGDIELAQRRMNDWLTRNKNW